MPADLKQIGFIGFVNLSLLATIVVWRTIRWYWTWEGPHTFESHAFRKKLAFHFLLLCCTSFDIPMYISFTQINDYALITYSFHKFSSAFLFAALSITISDWAAVLHDIHEYKSYPWVFGRTSLFAVNTVYFLISFVNFVLCYASTSLDDYTSSPIYVATIFFQIFISILLTCLMLYAGLKLYHRIQGAAGNLDERNGRSKRNRSSKKRYALMLEGGSEFRGALRNLNLVMATCTLCISVQMVMIILNYSLGYANDANATVGPPLVYWLLNSWIPIWGPVLSLLFLCRAHSKRKKTPFEAVRIQSQDAGANSLRNPLIDSADISLSAGDEYFSESDSRINASDGHFLAGGTNNNLLQAILQANQSSPSVFPPAMNQDSRNSNNSLRSSKRTRVSNPSSNGCRSTDVDSPESLCNRDSGLSESAVITVEEDEESQALTRDSLLSPDQSLMYYYTQPDLGNPLVPSQGNSGSNLSNYTEKEDNDGFRDTTITCPSVLLFPNIHHHAQQSFSYRGGDDHNGHFG